jgi:hypothetical protein
MRWRIISIIK